MKKFKVIFGLLFLIYCISSEPLFRPYNYITGNDKSIEAFNTIDEKYFLPTFLEPYRYKIHINTDIHRNDFNFSGYVEIFVKVVENTSSIIFHANENMQINEIIVDCENYTKKVSSTYNNETEQVHIKLINKILYEGEKCVLKMKYNSFLRGKGVDEIYSGFYRSSYTSATGEIIWIATTHFEPTHARHAFPCFDEPKYKAVFSLSITHGSENYTAISNTKILNQSRVDSERVITTFEDTPVMSTYLLCFVISNYAGIFDNSNGIDYGVYMMPHLIAEGEFALNRSVGILEKIEEYTGIKYELNKLDSISISDFPAGAMENWGLITFSTTAIHYNPQTSPHERTQRVLTVITHEFVHQYFGNLVTPEWWKYVWLSEGMAYLMQHYIGDMMEPEFKLMDTFVVATMQNSLRIDSLLSTRAMTTDVYSPQSIQRLFDDIAYDKSACVLGMMLNVMTAESFKTGLQLYLNARKYNTAVPSDLYENLEQIVDDNYLPFNTTIEQIMDTWANQKGYPVLNVVRDYTNNTINLSQERFLVERLDDEKPNSTWYIPYNYIQKSSAEFENRNNTTPTGWLSNIVSDKISVDLKSDEWILFNKYQTGYYRVKYDEKNWKLLENELKNEELDKRIHYINRAQLIDDLFNFARAGQLSYELALEFFEYFKKELNYFPIYSFNEGINQLISASFNTEISNQLNDYISNLTKSHYSYFGVEESQNDSYHDVFSRKIIISLLCRVNYDNCLMDTSKILAEHLINNRNLSVNLNDIIFKFGARKLNNNLLDDMWDKLALNITNDRRNYLIALSNTDNKNYLANILDQIVSNISKLSNEEIKTVLLNIMDNQEIGFELVLNCMMDNIEIMLELLEGENILSVLKELANKINTEEWLKIYSKLLIRYYQYLNKDDLADLLDYASNRVDWFEKQSGTLKKYLDTHYPVLI